MECCSNPELPPDYDDFSVANDEAISTDVSEESTEPRLTVSYSRATPLFRAIEKEDWESIIMFMNTSKWSNSMWNSSTDHFKYPAPSIQCKTWVINYNCDKQEDWSQLPIHAAISYNAPTVVLQKLIEAYPQGLRERDGEDMLPIHLAFGFGSSDAVIGLLLRTWPASAIEPGPGGRLPHECCELGPSKHRGEVYHIVAEQVSQQVERTQEELWKRCVATTSERLNIHQGEQLTKRHLSDVLIELLEDRAQLQELKEKLKMKYGTNTNLNLSPKKNMISPTSIDSKSTGVSPRVKGLTPVNSPIASPSSLSAPQRIKPIVSPRGNNKSFFGRNNRNIAV